MKTLLNLSKLRSVILIAMWVLLCTSDAWAVQQVSGYVRATDIVDTYVELTGNTTLTVNKNLYLRRLYGDYELTIMTNSNCQLMVDSEKDGAYAVNVKKLDIGGVGSVYITGYNCGAYVETNMTVNGGTITIMSRNQSDHYSSYSLRCGGNVTFNSCTANIEAKEVAMHIGGDLKVIGKSSKIWAYAGNPNAAYGVIRARNIRFYEGDISISSKTCVALKTGNFYIGEPVYENGEYVEKADKLKIYLNTSNQSKGDLHYTFECVLATGNVYIANCDLTAECNADVFRVFDDVIVYPGATISAWNRGDYGYSVFSVDGDFTAMKGSSIDVTGNRQGILCAGNVSISCDSFKARSKDVFHGSRAVYSNGNIVLNPNGQYTFQAGLVRPIYAGGSLVIDPPYLINNGEGYIVDGHEVSSKPFCYINRPSLYSWKPDASIGEASVVGGLNATYQVGQTINYSLPSNVTQNLYTYGVTMKYTWLRSQGLTPDDFEAVGEGASYTTTSDDVGHYFKVITEADKYTESLESNTALIIKAQNTAQPVAPVVYNGTTYLQVQNARSDQEYIVKAGDPRTDLTEADWANAVSPLSSATVVTVNGGTTGTYNTVYTRFKESATTFAGTVVAHTTSYLGTSQSTGDYVINVTGVNGTTVSYESDGSYNVPLNGVVRINLVSSNSNFNGVLGQYFKYHYQSEAVGQYGGLYSDQNCTQPIYMDANHFYKTVYLKFFKSGCYTSGNYLMISEPSLSARDVDFNVANADGTQILEKILINGNNVLSVYSGTTLTTQTTIFPMAANLSGVTINYIGTDGYGTTNTPPSLSLSSDCQYLTIDATGCKSDENVIYMYQFTQARTFKGRAYIKIIPTEPQGITVDKHYLVADPGDTIQVTAQKIPPYAEGEITWRSDYQGVAKVDENGRVIMRSNDNQLNAFLGSTANIIATAGGHSDTLVVKLNGHRYPLTVQGKYVHTYNAEDVLGDGGSVSYEAGTLRLNNASIAVNTPYPSNALEQVEYSNLEAPIPLTIELIGNNTITTRTGYGMKLLRSARFTGDGTLQLQGSYCGIASNSSIAIEDSVQVTAIGPTASTAYGQCGVQAASIDVSGSYAQLSAKGFRSVSVTDNIIHGYVTEPLNTILQDTFVAYADGTPVSNDWVVVKGEYEEYMRGDVDGSGFVDIDDVQAVISIILNIKTQDDYPGNANMNDDSSIDVDDMNEIIKIILGKG